MAISMNPIREVEEVSVALYEEIVAPAQGKETSGEQARLETPQRDTAALLHCPKCRAEKIARSRPKGTDRIVMRLLPRRPYRCLHCYHRFWHAEEFTEDPRRVKTWILAVGLIAAVSVWLVFGVKGSQAGNIGSVGGFFQFAEAFVPLESETERRSLIELSGFQPPREAEPEINELALAGVSKGMIRDKLSAAQVLAVQPETVTAAVVPTQPLGDQPAAELSVVADVDDEGIRNMLQQWARAWEAGNSDRYLEFYATDFEPGSGITLESWQQQRIARVVPAKAIELELRVIDVLVDDNGRHAIVRFEQDYQSAGYAEISRKEMQLNRIANQWYIASEAEL